LIIFKKIIIITTAHRLALVSYRAAKRVPYLQVVNEMLIAIFNFYQYSAPRYAKVRELQKLSKSKISLSKQRADKNLKHLIFLKIPLALLPPSVFGAVATS
jgi:hypothetical protein